MTEIDVQPHIFCTQWHRHQPNHVLHDHRIHGAPWVGHGSATKTIPQHFQALIDDRLSRFEPLTVRAGKQTVTLAPRAAGARILHYMPDHEFRFDLSVEYVDKAGNAIHAEFHSETLRDDDHTRHLRHKRRIEKALPLRLT